jgi:hypothetical protein
MEKGTANKQRLVEATSIAQAIRHCAKNTYDARVASSKDVATLAMGAQVAIEKAFETETTTTTQTT